MDSTKLKIVAGSIITESKLTKESKKQLLNFIQHEATNHQVMALMLDGKISKLDEQSQQIVEERFNNRFNENALHELSLGFLLGPLWVDWRALQFTFSAAARKCGAFGITIQRDVCIAKARLNMLQKRLQMMTKAIGNCIKSKDPMKCKADAQKEIAKIKAKIIKYTNKLKKLEIKLTHKGKMSKYATGVAKAEA